jgi:hypothetical protein
MKVSSLLPRAVLALALITLAWPLPLSGEAAPTPDPATEFPGLRVETTRATDGSKTVMMTVNTDVPKVEIYLDGTYKGHSPLDFKDIPPGIRQLTLKKDGFLSCRYTIECNPGETKKVYVELVRAEGTLSVRGAPENAEILIDGAVRPGTTLALGEGVHIVTIRAFGFAERKEEARIVRGEETAIEGSLERVPFAISAPKILKDAFNPDNPENLGTAGVSFTVSAPGEASLRVLSAAGTVVRTLTIRDFTSWRQTIAWDGRDDAGKALPDGEYTLELSGSGEPGGAQGAGQASGSAQAATPFRQTIRIDRSIAYPGSAPWRGVGAHGPVVSGTLMPKGTLIVAADTAFADGDFNPALSAIGGISDWIEAGLRVGIRADGGTGADVTVSGGVKTGFPNGLAGGAVRPAAFLRYETDRGVAFGSALDVRNGRYSAGISAEVAYGDPDGYFKDPAFSWDSGFALRVSFGNLSLAAWGTVASASGGDFNAPLSYGAGLSAQWIIPRTRLLLLGEGGWSYSDDSDGILSTRLGFGFSL